MPKTWVYIFALILPIILRVLLVNTSLDTWFWYHGYPNVYKFLAALAVNQIFLTYIGGWALPIFVVTMIGYWMIESEDEVVSSQFLLVPIAYVPFSLVVTMVATMNVDIRLFYIQPLTIIPLGYVYVFMWIIILWVLEKIGIVRH